MIEDVKELAIDGLMTDGGHHKQWFLEQILLRLGFDLDEIDRELSESDYMWERGIAP